MCNMILSKFLENELDKVKEYVDYSRATLLLPLEICMNEKHALRENILPEENNILQKMKSELLIVEQSLDKVSKTIIDYKNYYFNELTKLK